MEDNINFFHRTGIITCDENIGKCYEIYTDSYFRKGKLILKKLNY